MEKFFFENLQVNRSCVTVWLNTLTVKVTKECVEGDRWETEGLRLFSAMVHANRNPATGSRWGMEGSGWDEVSAASHIPPHIADGAAAAGRVDLVDSSLTTVPH